MLMDIFGKKDEKPKLCDISAGDIRKAAAGRCGQVATDPCARFNFPAGRQGNRPGHITQNAREG